MATILIVDDSSAARDLLGQVVKTAGHQPVFATDGPSGLHVAAQEQPALIFMDIVMPGQDGFSACRTLKRTAETASIPVVLVSAKTTPSDRFWGKKQGADDYVDKPYRPDTVVSIIQRFVR
jgi:twitching motility two-component system response regulator PilH